ncbi:hypothetical protein BVRB_2g046780 [Beta vulgaris subsp. vulgaris]|nr:hypothetical protein BVRB_2g046780 [Beta vulgaris subsp. vulgaris]
MRKRPNDENHVATPNPNGGKSKKTAADIVVEVVDKLTASSSSQLIMTYILSTFAAEEAKNAGLSKANPVSSSYPSQSVSLATNSTSKLEQPSPVSLPPAAAPSHQYQSIYRCFFFLLCLSILQIYTDSAEAKIPAVLEYLGTGLDLKVVDNVEEAEFILAHGTEALGLSSGSVVPKHLICLSDGRSGAPLF